MNMTFEMENKTSEVKESMSHVPVAVTWFYISKHGDGSHSRYRHIWEPYLSK